MKGKLAPFENTLDKKMLQIATQQACPLGVNVLSQDDLQAIKNTLFSDFLKFVREKFYFSLGLLAIPSQILRKICDEFFSKVRLSHNVRSHGYRHTVTHVAQRS